MCSVSVLDTIICSCPIMSTLSPSPWLGFIMSRLLIRTISCVVEFVYNLSTPNLSFPIQLENKTLSGCYLWWQIFVLTLTWRKKKLPATKKGDTRRQPERVPYRLSAAKAHTKRRNIDKYVSIRSFVFLFHRGKYIVAAVLLNRSFPCRSTVF